MAIIKMIVTSKRNIYQYLHQQEENTRDVNHKGHSIIDGNNNYDSKDDKMAMIETNVDIN